MSEYLQNQEVSSHLLAVLTSGWPALIAHLREAHDYDAWSTPDWPPLVHRQLHLEDPR